MLKKIFITALMALLILAVGCTQKENTGTLVMKITDAPSDLKIEKALITVSEVQVHKASENEVENSTDESGWSTVVIESKTYDLIQIKDVAVGLGNATLPAGKYTQVRLTLEKAIVTINGKDYDLTVPTDRVKLTKGFTIEANKTTTLTLDFNAQESIKVNGKNEYKLNPVIKIIQ